MDFPKGHIAVAALVLGALAGQAQAQQCSHHQNGNSSFNMQQMTNALQPQMSPMCAMQAMTGPTMSMSQSQMGRFGSSSCQMSRMSSMQSMTSQMSLMRPMTPMSRLSSIGPMPFMQSETPFLESMQLQQQPGLQQLQLIVQQQQQLIVQQQLQLQEQKHQDALLKTEQLKDLHLQMTALQEKMSDLQQPPQLNGLQPSALNDLQQRVNSLQDQLNGVAKAPKSLLQQMSDLQDQMSSLQQRVTAKPADLIAALRTAK